jgi:hypothetical protein
MRQNREVVMKSRYIIVATLILSFISLIGIASIGHVAVATSYSQVPGNSTISATTAISIYLPIVSNNTFIFFDDFSDPDSGWPINDSGDVQRSYQDGEYKILIQPENFWGGSVPPLSDISNYSVDAEMRIPDGSAGFYGLIFDRVDWDQFYVFVISPGSQIYAVLRHDPAWVLLTPFTPSSAIVSGSATNHLRVDRNGEQISVYVNDQLLISLSDNTYFGSSNEVGLFAQSSDSVPATMHFDNFTVSYLGATTDQRLTSLVENPAVLSTEGQGFVVLEP